MNAVDYQAIVDAVPDAQYTTYSAAIIDRYKNGDDSPDVLGLAQAIVARNKRTPLYVTITRGLPSLPWLWIAGGIAAWLLLRYNRR